MPSTFRRLFSRQRAIVALSCIALVAFAIPRSQFNIKTSRKSPELTFAQGESSWYTLSYSAQLSLTDPTNYQKGSTVTLPQAAITGEMFSKVIKTGPDGNWLAVQIMNPTCAAEEVQNPDCRLIYGSPLLLRVSSHGEILESLTPNSLSRSEGRKLFGLLEQLSVFSAPSPAGSRDITSEDSLGTSLIRYQRKNGLIIKRKLDYLSLKDTSGYLDQAKIEHSSFAMNPSLGGSWFDSFEGTEQLSLHQKGKKQLHFDLSISLKKSASLPVEPDWSADTVEQIKESFQKGVRRPISRKDTFTQEREREAALKQPINLNDISRSLQQELSPGKHIALLSDLAARLRVLPEETTQISNLIVSRESSDSVRRDLFYVLQSAGTDASRKALLDLAIYSGLSLKDQKRAVVALGFIEHSESSIEQLWRLTEFNQTTEEHERSQVALFSLGTATEKLAHQSPEKSTEIIDRMKTALNSHLSNNDYDGAETFLLALGNSRSESATQSLIENLNSPSDRIRRTSAQALEVSARESAASPFATQLLLEESADVRAAIVDGLLKIPPTHETLTAAVQAFTEENDSAVRYRLARYFVVASQKFPQARRAIASLMPTEPDKRVFELLAQAGFDATQE